VTEILESAAESTLVELLQARRSCRAFQPDPVPREVIEQILALAQLSPSWCNTQPWQLVIPDGAATERFRKGLAEHSRSSLPEPDFAFPTEYRGVYRERRLETAMQLYASVGIAKGDRAASAQQTLRNFDLFDAPHVAIVTTDEALGLYGAVDCGLYVNTLLLAAQSLGVATIPQAAVAGYSSYVREFFSLGADRKVLCAISFGYADQENPANNFRTTRAAVDIAATWVMD
jgi:nitroreductase